MVDIIGLNQIVDMDILFVLHQTKTKRKMDLKSFNDSTPEIENF